MPLINSQDAMYGGDDLPGRAAPIVPAPQMQAPDSALNIASAALRQGNVVSSLYDRLANNPDSTAPAVPGYDALQDISGYEDQAARFTRSASPEQTQVIKNRISQERADRATIGRAGWAGVTASLAAGAIDPLTLASMAIAPEVAGPSRIARFAVGAATNVGVGLASDAALSSIQEMPHETTAVGIGANALLGGVLGSIGRSVPKSEFDAAASRVSERAAPIESTAGAQAVPTTTLAQESIANGGGAIASSLGKVSPVTRVMSSDSVEARRLAQQLVDVPYMLDKNFEGVATPTSAETRIGQLSDQRNATMVKALDDAFVDYKKTGGDLSRSDFSEEVSNAMRNGDTSDIPQAANLARETRKTFDADRTSLKEVGALPEDFELLGAKSYFPRAYDQYAIVNNRTALEQALYKHFQENPLKDENGVPIDRESAEVTDAVHSTLDKIQGTTRGTVEFGGQSVRNPAPLKGRKLDVPDSVLQPWLSSDFEHVMHSYNRSVVPQIEMRRAFGSTDMATQMQKITDEFHIQSTYATSDAAKEVIRKKQAATLADIEGMRDRVLGTNGPRVDQNQQLVRAANLLRTFNYVRLLGSQMLSALSDVGRIVTRYGLTNTSARTAQFVYHALIRNKLSILDAQRMGTALDWTLHTRAKSLSEIGDELGGSKLDKVAQSTSAFFTRATGMATWDASLRTITSALEQDAILRAVKSQRLSGIERAKLASRGIGDAEIEAIRGEMQHWSNEGGLNRARTELWGDQDVARKVEQAVYRSATQVAFHIGKGDIPFMMSTGLGKSILQFRSFQVSSINRLMIPLAQGLAHGDIKAVNGLAVLLTLGSMSYVTKELSSGRKPDLSVDRLIPEALNYSGVLGYLPDLWDPLAGMAHLPRFSRFADRSLTESIAGPTAGTLSSIADTVKGASSGQLKASDVHKFRQLLPFQNVFYLRTLVNALEGKTADALGAKDATGKDFASYVNPSEFDEPKRTAPDKKHLFGVDAIPNSF